MNFEKTKKTIIKQLELAETYYTDGAPRSAARVLIEAQVRLAKLTNDTNQASIDREQAMGRLRR